MIFFIFGLSPFVSYDNKRNITSKCLSILIRLLNISLITCFVFSTLYFVSVNKSFDNMSFQIYTRFTLVCTVCTCLVTFFENLCNLQLARRTFQAMSNTINSLELFFGIQFPYKSLIKWIRWKIWLQTFCLFSVAFVKIILIKYEDMFVKRDIAYFIIHIIKCLQLTHFLFYVDFIKYSLISLNEKIGAFENNRRVLWLDTGNLNMLFILRHIKHIHSEICHVSRCVNYLFGWFLVIKVIDLCMMTICYGFWIYINIKWTEGDGNLANILTKSKFILKIIL